MPINKNLALPSYKAKTHTCKLDLWFQERLHGINALQVCTWWNTDLARGRARWGGRKVLGRGNSMCNGVRDRERERKWYVGKLKSSSRGRVGKERIRSVDSLTPKFRLGASLLCLCSVLSAFHRHQKKSTCKTIAEKASQTPKFYICPFPSVDSSWSPFPRPLCPQVGLYD